jgi:hypothetical protein
MEKIAIALVAIGAAVALIVLSPLITLLAVAFGAIAGWLVGFAFPTLASSVFTVTGFYAYQWGAMLAFAGSFFKSVTTKSE